MLLGACIWCLCALSPLLLSGVASISVPLPFSRPSLCLHLFYLCGSRVKSDEEFADDDDELLLSKATGADQKQETSSKLSKVFQLSGFSDPVYAEAYVNVHQYDIHLDGTEVPAFLSTAHSNKHVRTVRVCLKKKHFSASSMSTLRYSFGCTVLAST